MEKGPRAFWLLLAVYLALVVAFAWNPTPFAQGLAAIGIALALGHAGIVYGWHDALVFCAIVLAISFAMENIGVATGFPFGHYHFAVAAALPHVGAIPVIVGPLWFGMGYYSLVVATVLMGDSPVRGTRLFLLPLLAAGIMTAWDLVMDPPEATIAHAWLWHDGGADFGVPLSNYFGWLLTAWLFFQFFALYRRATPQPHPGRALQLVAILLYAASGLTHVTPWLMGAHGMVADAGGHLWSIAALRQSAVLVMACTMLPITLLTLWRLRAPFPLRSGRDSVAAKQGLGELE